jgi:hypothetical protein
MTTSSMFEAKLLADHLRAHGEDDEVLIVDMIEGQTSALEAVDRIIAAIGEAEQHQAVLKIREDEMADRRARFAKRTESLRGTLLAWLGDVGLKKLERPEATLSVSEGKPSVNYTADFGVGLPEQYLKTTTAPDKAAVRKAVLAGENIIGAALGNSPPTLAIRRS